MIAELVDEVEQALEAVREGCAGPMMASILHDEVERLRRRVSELEGRTSA